MQWLVTAFLGIPGLVLLGKYLGLRREVERITQTIRSVDIGESNRQVRTASRDRRVGELAGAVNALYGAIREERAEHLRRMDETRRSMANISHDLRTPLTSILGYVRLLEDPAGSPEERRRYLAVVHAKARQLSELVSGLFLLTRLENGAYPLQLETVDAGELLAEELAGFYDAFAPSPSGREPVIDLAGVPLRIAADRIALSRIFSNLLQNMAKHGAEDIVIRCGAEGTAACLTFANRTRGLSGEDVDRLFERFFTSDRMRSGENTGLGLAIVKEFAEAMNGSVTAELKGDMLEFTLRFPLLRPQAAGTENSL